MNSKKFSEAMSELDSKYVDEAISYKKKAQKPVWVKRGAVAACLVCNDEILGASSKFKGVKALPSANATPEHNNIDAIKITFFITYLRHSTVLLDNS